MADLSIITKALDFIEDHLRASIGVGDVAQAMRYSLYYFSRNFQQATHHTPYDYLIRRRIAEASHDLLNSERNIIDIAFEYQFNSHETFTRAFKRVMGATPSEWRANPNTFRSYMPRLTGAHLQHLHANAPWHFSLEHLPAIELTGVMTLLPAERGREKAWHIVSKHPRYRDERKFNITYFDNMEASALFCGIPQGEIQHASDLWVEKRIPPLKVVRCTHRGKYNTLSLTLDVIYHTWMPQNGYIPIPQLHIEQWDSHCDPIDGPFTVFIPVQRRPT